MQAATRLRLATLTTQTIPIPPEVDPLAPLTNPSIRPSLHLPAKSPEQVALPRVHCTVGQILYAKDVYKDFPAWKRWAAIHLHIPLFNFLQRALGLFPPTGQDANGVHVFNAHQGCFFTREEAEVDAARYPHGYVVPNMPLGQSLTADTPEHSSIYFAHSPPLRPLFEEVDKIRATAQAVRTIQ